MSAAASNRAPAQMCDASRTETRLTASVMQTARACWSVKTRLHLAEITGYSVRACESWLADDRKIPSDALAALLHSDWGLEFLLVVMEESRAPWWRWVLNLIGVVRRRAAERRVLEQADRSDRELAAAIQRAEAALVVSDEDFHRPYLDALGAVLPVPRAAGAHVRASGRTVAAPTKGRR